MQVQARKNPVELQTLHLLITVWMIIFAARRLPNSLTSAMAELTMSIKAELEPVEVKSCQFFLPSLVLLSLQMLHIFRSVNVFCQRKAPCSQSVRLPTPTRDNQSLVSGE